MIAEVCNSNFLFSKEILKIFVHHKGVSLEIIVLRRESDRVSDFLKLEVRDIEVDCMKVVGRILEKTGFGASRTFQIEQIFPAFSKSCIHNQVHILFVRVRCHEKLETILAQAFYGLSELGLQLYVGTRVLEDSRKILAVFSDSVHFICCIMCVLPQHRPVYVLSDL